MPLHPQDRKKKLTENLAVAAAALGIEAVKEIAVASLHNQPNMTLREFMAILNKLQERIDNGEVALNAAGNPGGN